MSIEYYNKNAKKYINDTENVEMSNLYSKFEKYLSAKASILDIGCGSGRDSLYFKEKGYDVFAHDGSKAMVDYAKQFLGERVALAKFDEFDTKNLFDEEISFDGLWACSSLLHVAEEDMLSVLKKYITYLKENGVFFMSFKHRENNHEKDGRIFTNFTKEKLDHLLGKLNDICILEYVETVDARDGRQDEGWISVIIQKG